MIDSCDECNTKYEDLGKKIEKSTFKSDIYGIYDFNKHGITCLALGGTYKSKKYKNTNVCSLCLKDANLEPVFMVSCSICNEMFHTAFYESSNHLNCDNYTQGLNCSSLLGFFPKKKDEIAYNIKYNNIDEVFKNYDKDTSKIYINFCYGSTHFDGDCYEIHPDILKLVKFPKGKLPEKVFDKEKKELVDCCNIEICICDVCFGHNSKYVLKVVKCDNWDWSGLKEKKLKENNFIKYMKYFVDGNLEITESMKDQIELKNKVCVRISENI